MFSHILRNVNLDVESSPGVSEKIVQLIKLEQESSLDYENAKTTLYDIHKEIAQKDEQLCNIERERLKLMSDLALQMQAKHDLSNRVESLKNKLESTKFDLKKYHKMKISSADLENLNHIKKTFITFKNMMRIYFDYSNGPDARKQKGYMCNIISKRLSYFEYDLDIQTFDEISRSIWNQLKSISSDQWMALTP